MVFSSLTFLFFFLPLALLLYYISPKKVQNLTLLIISLIFYAWGEPIYVALIIFSAGADYIFGLLIGTYRQQKKWKARLALYGSLFINIGVLSFFKYADFLVENINDLLNMNLQSLDLPLPIGISFYTFQTMSYIIDVYRGEIQAQKNPITLMMYISLFPQLIAGPIVRYKAIEQSLDRRQWNGTQFMAGVNVFIIGLGKKVLLANNIGQLWDSIQQQNMTDMAILTAWLGIIAFALQLYFDFSGYSDMAIGLGKMLGFNFPANFRYPYISKSVAEFWRRWHISLGSWFRDYVYIPLGGSRVGRFKLYRNLLIVWGLTGLWHGASWNFVFWGLYFGLFIALERTGWQYLLEKLPHILQHLYLIVVILISWVFFVFEDIHDIFSYFGIMFGVTSNTLMNSRLIYDVYSNVLLIGMAIVLSTPILQTIKNRMRRIKSRPLHYIYDGLTGIFYIFILILSTAYLVDESFNPFLYFRF